MSHCNGLHSFGIIGFAKELMKRHLALTDTDRVWIVEIADLAGQILTGGPCAHWSRFDLFTGVYDVALCKQLVQISIEVPAPFKC